MSIFEQIRQFREKHLHYDRATLDKFADQMEEMIGEAEMWRVLRTGFSTYELLENLEYIAKEKDL